MVRRRDPLRFRVVIYLFCAGYISLIYITARSLRDRSFEGQQLLQHSVRIPREDLQLCEFNADDVKMLECNKTVPTWQALEKRFPMVLKGGHYMPPNCRARHNTAIIIPYRNREEHLKLFLQHMHPFLQAQQLEYTIYVIELQKDVIFKKGLLMNAGFIEVSKQNESRCFAFHDVDMLPMNASIPYSCKQNTVYHPAHWIRQYNFEEVVKGYLGGVLMFHEADFRKVNGFSNLYWGWGGEDDDMARRIHYKRIPVEWPARNLLYESWTHGHEVVFKNRFSFVQTATRRMHKDGINSAIYTVNRTEKKPLYTLIHVSANQTDGSYNGMKPIYEPYGG